jgi:hypothetical protein
VGAPFRRGGRRPKGGNSGTDFSPPRCRHFGEDDAGNRAAFLKQGNDTLTVKQENQKTKIEARQAIELKVGKNRIRIDQKGITLSGMHIKLNAQLTAEIVAQLSTKLSSQLQTQVSGDALTQLSGGVAMIS